MVKKRAKRRNFLIISMLFVAVMVFYSFFYEPKNIAVHSLSVPGWTGPRLVHVSDIHYDGDREYITQVVELINAQKADYVCFTGDFITNKSFLPEILDILDELESPVIAVPGNHEYWQGVDLIEIDKRLRAKGGRLLVNEVFQGDRVRFIGNAELEPLRESDITNGVANVLLAHYPSVVDLPLQDGLKYDLILSGHTHGGQVRLPGYGALITPYSSSGYESGLYETEKGPLYVTSGVGWLIKVRFFCRPEIVVIEN